MKKYIALLRGINVGGKNKISMPVLKNILEQNGFANVSTYINSGNIIFSHDGLDIIELQKKCHALIKQRLSLDIAVAVFTAKEFEQSMQNAPEWWNEDEGSKHNAIFVIPPASVDEVFISVGEAKPEYEKVFSIGNVIFWSAPLKTFSRTRWSKITATKAYDKITIRNANTANKLLQLLKN